jgi:hypothetical protein
MLTRFAVDLHDYKGVNKNYYLQGTISNLSLKKIKIYNILFASQKERFILKKIWTAMKKWDT